MYNKIENTAVNHWQRLCKTPKMMGSGNHRRVERCFLEGQPNIVQPRAKKKKLNGGKKNLM